MEIIFRASVTFDPNGGQKNKLQKRPFRLVTVSAQAG